MRVEFAATVAKDLSAEEFNEDRFLFGIGGAVAVLSDGASESFDSRTWATLLCELSCSGEGIHPGSIAKCVELYNERYDLRSLSWSKAAAFERGSFATLLSVRHYADRGEVEILAVGDSVVLLCEGGVVQDRFPLQASEEFERRPELLSTKGEYNTFVADTQFNVKHVAIRRVSSSTKALLLTDAVGHWCYRALEEGRDDWRFLLSVEREDDFRSFVIDARLARELRLDDTTLVRLSF